MFAKEIPYYLKQCINIYLNFTSSVFKYEDTRKILPHTALFCIYSTNRAFKSYYKDWKS